MSTRIDWPQGALNRERTLEILREHNAWRRGALGPQTDPRMLGLALDAVIEALASATQPPSGGSVRAKQLEWQEGGPSEWCDRHHGFHITQDDQEPEENRFTAAWGEGEPEWFPTLEEAQTWCQEAIDRHIREWAVTAPPSAPVGVEAALRIAHRHLDMDAMRVSHCKDAAAIEAALAQQPTPSAPVGVEGLAGKIGVHYAQHESCKPGVPFYAFTADELRRFAAALAQQPAAVDGAMVERHADAALAHMSNALDDLDSNPDQRPVPLIREAMEHLRELRAALAAQPGGEHG